MSREPLSWQSANHELKLKIWAYLKIVWLREKLKNRWWFNHFYLNARSRENICAWLSATWLMLVLISHCHRVTRTVCMFWGLAVGTERVHSKIKMEKSWLTSATELLTASICACDGLLGSVAMGAAEQALNNKVSNEAVMTSHIETKLWNFVVVGFIFSSLLV